MLESLRARLLLWHTLVLAILIGVYASAVTYAYWRSLLVSVDAELSSIAAAMADSLDPDVSGTFDLNFPPRFRETTFGGAAGGTSYVVWSARGELVDRSEGAPRHDMPVPGRRTFAGVRELVTEGPAGARILVARPLATAYAARRSLAFAIANIGVVVLLVSFAGGSFLASRALAPVARISHTAAAMVGGDLNARIPVRDTDSELEQLARALNEAFDRLHQATETQRQFTADASHEFRTPLATLRAEVEWGLKRQRSSDEYRGTLEKVHHAVQRLTQIADRLLRLAEGDIGADMHVETVDVAALVREIVELLDPLAADRGVLVHTQLQRIHVVGHSTLLRDVCWNLLANAIVYNRTGGRVEITLDGVGSDAVLTVSGTGCGISAADLPRIFDRFFRADSSRARETGGAGLGLAIVKDAVERHGGFVTCNSALGEGSTFVVRIPVARTPAMPSIA